MCRIDHPKDFIISETDVNHMSLLYYDWCRTIPCQRKACNAPQGEPHHVVKIGSGGDRTRASKRHFYIASLCHPDHRIADQGPEIFFEETGENIWEIVANQQAEFLWQLATGKLNELIEKMTVYDPLIGRLKNMHWKAKRG